MTAYHNTVGSAYAAATAALSEASPNPRAPADLPTKQTSSGCRGNAPIIDAGQASVVASFPITRRNSTDEEPHTYQTDRACTSSAILDGLPRSLQFSSLSVATSVVNTLRCAVFTCSANRNPRCQAPCSPERKSDRELAVNGVAFYRCQRLSCKHTRTLAHNE